MHLVLALGGCSTVVVRDLEPVLELGVQPDWEAPDNRWPTARPPSNLSGEGFEEGQTAPDLRLPDQFADEVSLWQFYGQVVLIDTSVVQCAPCWDWAPILEQLAEELADDGLVVITVLQLDELNADPTLSDLVAWADTFGLTTPVLDDGYRWVDAPGWPYFMLVDREMHIRNRGIGLDEELVRAEVLTALQEG